MATFSDAITTAAQLHQAETATYMADAAIGVAFIVIILIVANIIAWQPGAHDGSPAKRRLLWAKTAEWPRKGRGWCPAWARSIPGVSPSPGCFSSTSKPRPDTPRPSA